MCGLSNPYAISNHTSIRLQSLHLSPRNKNKKPKQNLHRENSLYELTSNTSFELYTSLQTSVKCCLSNFRMPELQVTTKITLFVLKYKKIVSGFSQTQQFIILFCLEDDMFRSLDHLQAIVTKLRVSYMQRKFCIAGLMIVE